MRNFPRKDEFLFEAAENFRMAGEIGANELERDEALQFEVPGFVNGAHTALAEELENLETLGENGASLELSL